MENNHFNHKPDQTGCIIIGMLIFLLMLILLFGGANLSKFSFDLWQEIHIN
jgi:DMSO/TMAO reductase YedYZ heme-binding membrane subunit